MTLVKICGIKTIEEVNILNNYVPDFAGFIFSESKRKVDLIKASSLIENLSKKIKRVGVFVNEPVSFIKEAYEKCGLDVLQLHGEEDMDYVIKLKDELGEGVVIWRGIRVKDEAVFDNVEKSNIDAILLDTFSKHAHGGTGEAFNWSIAKNFAINNKIVLAGGLNPKNVISAIDILKPYCVDVSSGVEIDGYKDEILVKDFITKVKKEVKV